MKLIVSEWIASLSEDEKKELIKKLETSIKLFQQLLNEANEAL